MSRHMTFVVVVCVTGMFALWLAFALTDTGQVCDTSPKQVTVVTR